MSNIQRFEPGHRMCSAVVHGNLIWLSGQTAPESGNTVTEQSRAITQEVDRILGELGATKSDILQVMVWLADMDDFEDMNAVYDAWIDPANMPARACGESRLARDEIRVEFTVTAARP